MNTVMNLRVPNVEKFLSAQLAASHEGLNSMKLVSLLVIPIDIV
jgi:hypothetical protein